MNFTLNVLGTASAKPSANRNSSAQVLDVRGRLFLIDCGEGTQRQFCRQHLSFERVDAIFISHIHGDHIFGLFGLLSTVGLATRRASVRIFGPNSLGPVLKFFLSYFGEQLGISIDFTPVKAKAPKVIFENKFMTVEAFPLNHRIETYGYLFREKTPQLNVCKSAIEEYGLGVAEICSLKNGEDVVLLDGDGLEPEVGGDAGPITAYQRNPGSGSQSMMLRFMGDDELMEAPGTETMGSIIMQVADYEAGGGSIGYSFRYYFTEMVGNDQTHMLNLDGVAPTVENIQNGSYPALTTVYAVYLADNENPLVRRLCEWTTSDEARAIVEQIGYVPYAEPSA